MFVEQLKEAALFAPSNPTKVSYSVEFTWEQFLCCGYETAKLLLVEVMKPIIKVYLSDIKIIAPIY